MAKTANSKIGMIEPRSGITTDARQGFSLARIVVKPDQQRVVPLRVINMSQTPIELTSGAKTGCLRSRAKRFVKNVS